MVGPDRFNEFKQGIGVGLQGRLVQPDNPLWRESLKFSL
jgi:hypothetical protein